MGPFDGSFYVSELALNCAAAALSGEAAARHREAVLRFYSTEQAWLRGELEGLPGIVVQPSPCPFFPLRGPSKALERACGTNAGGATLQRFGVRLVDGQCSAVCLVSDRASNKGTVEALRRALEAL